MSSVAVRSADSLMDRGAHMGGARSTRASAWSGMRDGCSHASGLRRGLGPLAQSFGRTGPGDGCGSGKPSHRTGHPICRLGVADHRHRAPTSRRRSRSSPARLMPPDARGRRWTAPSTSSRAKPEVAGELEPTRIDCHGHGQRRERPAAGRPLTGSASCRAAKRRSNSASCASSCSTHRPRWASIALAARHEKSAGRGAACMGLSMSSVHRWHPGPMCRSTQRGRAVMRPWWSEGSSPSAARISRRELVFGISRGTRTMM